MGHFFLDTFIDGLFSVAMFVGLLEATRFFLTFDQTHVESPWRNLFLGYDPLVGFPHFLRFPEGYMVVK